MEGFPHQNARTQRFTFGVPRSFLVANDDSRVLFLRSSASDDPLNSLWALDPVSGVEKLIANPAFLLENVEGADSEVVPAAEATRRQRSRELTSGIVDFNGLNNLSRVCFALAGRIFMVETDEARVVELPSTGDAVDPRLSPDGTSVAYLSGRTLRLTGTNGDHRLVGTSSETISWGAAEFIAAEEMGRTRGHWWAPDGSSILAARVDVSSVAEWWISNSINPAVKPVPIRYPATGTANAKVDLVVLSLNNTEPIYLDWDKEEFEYLTAVDWSENSSPVISLQSRDQKTLAFFTVDVITGDTEEIYRITSNTWVDLVPGVPQWWESKLLTVQQDNDTFRLFLNGKPFSPQGLQIRRVIGTDKYGVIALGSTTPTDINVVRVKTDGTVEVVAGGEGVSDASLGSEVLVITTSTMSGSKSTVFPGNHDIVSHVEEPIVKPDPIFHVVGRRDLNVALLMPEGHQDSVLPVLMDPYGGPHAQRVLRSKGLFLTSQWFANQGFAVVVADGRGTPGRGPTWERGVLGDLASPVLDDQVEALHEIARLDGRLDLERVAIRGWSFGGYLAALAILRRPDVFHVGIAGAPVTNWALYDTHYTERYLGDPGEALDAYHASNLYVDSTVPHRQLLLIHGVADDNVLFAHTLSLSQLLLKAKYPHYVIPLSEVTHVASHQTVTENLLLLQADFLKKSLNKK